MKKSIVPTIVLGCVLLTVPAFAKNSDTVNNQYREQIIEYTDKEDKEIIPYSMVITTGSYRRNWVWKILSIDEREWK